MRGISEITNEELSYIKSMQLWNKSQQISIDEFKVVTKYQKSSLDLLKKSLSLNEEQLEHAQKSLGDNEKNLIKWLKSNDIDANLAF